MNQDQVDRIIAARAEAIQNVNTGGEIFFVCGANLQALTDLLHAEGMPEEMYENGRVWESAIIKARADGKLERRPTREDITRRRQLNDVKDGRQTKIKESSNPNNVLQDMFENLNKTLNSKPAEKTTSPEVKVQFPTLEQFRTLSTQEQAKYYRSLSTENLRLFSKRLQEQEHTEKYGTAPIGSVSAPRHIR